MYLPRSPPLFLHAAPHAALLCLHHGHGPPSCPPKHHRFHRQRTRFATWLGRLGTRRRDGSIHCLSVLGLLLRLLLMQLLAWWLAGCCCCCWQAIRLGQQQRRPEPTRAQLHMPVVLLPCACACSSFLAMEGGPVSRRFSHLISWSVSSLRVHDHKLLSISVGDKQLSGC